MTLVLTLLLLCYCRRSADGRGEGRLRGGAESVVELRGHPARARRLQGGGQGDPRGDRDTERGVSAESVDLRRAASHQTQTVLRLLQGAG